MSLRRTRRALLGLDLFLGCTAVAGGVALLLGWLTPPLDLLQGSPFADYTVPTLLLTVVVGGCGLSAAWLVRQGMDAGVLAPPSPGARSSASRRSRSASSDSTGCRFSTPPSAR